MNALDKVLATLGISRFDYNYSLLEPLALANEVPHAHLPRLSWWKAVAEVTNQIIDNMHAIKSVRDSFDPLTSTQRRVESIRGSDNDDPEVGVLIDLPKLLVDVFDAASEKTINGRPSGVEHYGSLFQQIGDPQAPRLITNDADFTRMRVAGPNPMVIRRLAAVPRSFAVTETDFQAALGDPSDSLAAAEATGRLYICDYSALAGLPSGTYPSAPKYLCAPMALFVVPGSGGALRPVAIQCGQSDACGPIFTPGDGWSWSLAKTAVTVADANHHQTVSHVGRTHLFIEPFVIATDRALTPSHPVYKLLRPHFEGTLYINSIAVQALLNRGGGVNKLTAPTIDAARTAAVVGVLSFSFDQAWLAADLATRGVDDAGALPDYPYRDDAALIWDALHTWVKDYLSIHYGSDADVRGDAPLQTWAAELVDMRGGRVRGFGEGGGTIRTLDYLIEALTRIVFICSAQHAAVNFPQGPHMSDASQFPLAAYAPPPTRKDATQADLLAALPPLDQALRQLNVLTLLSSVQHTELGDYRSGWFGNDAVAAPLLDFRKRLAEIEKVIDDRNLRRYAPYPFLKPSLIPQSINI